MEFGLFLVGSTLLLLVAMFLAERKLEVDARKLHVTIRRAEGQNAHYRFVATDLDNHSAFAARPCKDAILYRWYTGVGDQGYRILGWRQRVLNRALQNFNQR